MMNTTSSDSGDAPKESPAADQQQRDLAGPREITSGELLDGAREVVIVHAGERYRLVHTKNDKLLLQK